MITTGLLDKPMYCAETWSLKKVSETKLEASHHRWLRKILHILQKDNTSNQNDSKCTQQRELEEVIFEWWLRWCGHIGRMSTDVPAKSAISRSSLGGTRNIGHPTLTGRRWWNRTSTEEVLAGVPVLTTDRRLCKELNALSSQMWKGSKDKFFLTPHTTEQQSLVLLRAGFHSVAVLLYCVLLIVSMLIFIYREGQKTDHFWKYVTLVYDDVGWR